MVFLIANIIIYLQTEQGCKAQNLSTASFLSCQYTISLYDTYGDGWNGGYLDVLVNNLVVLDNITLSLGPGPATFLFSVNSGDQITTIYIAGNWPQENFYLIFNSSGVQVWASPPTPTGPSNILPGQLFASCPAPPVLTPRVFSSAGAFYTTGNATLSLTVGESIIESYIVQDNVLNTGFQQVETFVPIVKTWNGSIDDNWSVAGNWTANGVPVSIDNVNIPATAPRMPVVRITGFSCRNISIDPNSSLKIGPGVLLRVYGN